MSLTKKVHSRDEVLDRIFELHNKNGRKLKRTKDEFRKEFMPSGSYVKMTVPMSQVESPQKPKYGDVVKKKAKNGDNEPIVIDKRIRNNDWGTDTEIIDGKHRAEAAKRSKDKNITAYIGIKAISHFVKGREGKWWTPNKTGRSKSSPTVGW